MSKKYLLVDFGESGIIYTVVTGNPVVSVNSLTRAISTGSALHMGNKASNYVFYVQDICTKINEKLEEFDITEVVLNLPSLYDNLVLLPNSVKAGTLHQEVIKSDLNFDTENMIVVGKLKNTDTGSIIATASVVNKGYMDIIKGINEGTKINYMTSFTRLQFIAERKVQDGLVNEPFIIMDSGYAKTRVVLFNGRAIPTGTIQCNLSGHDIIDKMGTTSALDADNDFTARQKLTEDVKSYVNSNVNIICKQIKANTKNTPCKIFIYGGLSTLPWEKVCKGYDIQKMICGPLKEKNMVIAVKVALMFDTPTNTCRIANRVKTDTRKKAVTVAEDIDIDEESYVDSVKKSAEKATTLSAKVKKKQQDPPAVKKKPKPKPVEEYEEEDYEEEDVDEVPVKKKPKKEKPKKEKPPKKRKPTVVEDYEDEEDDYEDDADNRKFQPKTAIIITLVLILTSIICSVSFGMFMEYKSNAKQTEITITNQKASLVAYCQKVIDSRGIKIASFDSEIINEQEFIYIGINDIAQDTLNELLVALNEACDVVQQDIVYGANDTVSLKLSITFK